MTVYRLDISYDGTGFRGYARQDGVRTVQEELETALSTYLRSPVSTSVAGRTDAGVHARRQVISFQHDGEIDLTRLPRAVNGIIGPEVSVLGVFAAPDDFNARYSAVWRRYRYQMDMRPVPDPLNRHVVWHVGKPLDLGTMTASAEVLVGEHDFSSFCRAVEGKSNVRRLTELSLAESDGRLDFWVQANAFCHQMVRSMVGYLYDVGRGFSDGSRVAEVIEARDRSTVATVAPAHGLILWDVGYD
ncbi:MAG TPA: tRNA pseudouridine(38-40) synthase TruA [Acidimicrobiia bacterium]|nr:tRNA pseudouridine(38-40) synthase TruA [Acidimicrobiia bacterium]